MKVYINEYGLSYLPLHRVYDAKAKRLVHVDENLIDDLISRYDIPAKKRFGLYQLSKQDFNIWGAFFNGLQQVELIKAALVYLTKDEEEIFNEAFDWVDTLEIPMRCLERLEQIRGERNGKIN